MIAFAARRLAQGLLTLLLVTLLVHVVLGLLPGDPIRALFGPARPEAGVYEALRAQFRFDEPWYARYWLWLGDLVRGDWGHSFPGRARNRVVMGPPVSAVLRSAVPVSARLLAVAVAVQCVAGVAAGVLAVRRPRTAGWVQAAAIVLVAAPVIVLAYVLQAAVARGLGWFPVAGLGTGWTAYVLPAVALSAGATAYVALLTRSELGETLGAPYVRAARGRAIPAGRLVGIHALRPALVPVVALVAASTGQLLTGLVIVEGVFGIPGVGGTLFAAVQSRDQALLLGLLVFSAAAVVVASVLGDVVHALVDPRARDRLTGR